MVSFSEQFKAAVERIQAHTELVAENIVLGVGESLVDKSVIGDWESWSDSSKSWRPREIYIEGQFKGSWHHSYGAPSDDYTSTIDKTGHTSMAEITYGAKQEAVSKHFITNNVGYALDLERGWSPQSPAGGIVGRTELEFPQIVRTAVTKSK